MKNLTWVRCASLASSSSSNRPIKIGSSFVFKVLLLTSLIKIYIVYEHEAALVVVFTFKKYNTLL